MKDVHSRIADRFRLSDIDLWSGLKGESVQNAQYIASRSYTLYAIWSPNNNVTYGK